MVVVVDRSYNVAQYGQWDGYPGGQGIDALKFLRDRMDHQLFTAKRRAVRVLTHREIVASWEAAGAEPGEVWITMSVADKHEELFPQLSRNTGAGILELIQNSPDGLGVDNDLKFAGDSLMCEWAYVVDLDTNRFEVYKGFNKTPLTEKDRFYYLPMPERSTIDGTQFHQCKMIASFDLLNLPSDGDFLDVTERAARLARPEEYEDEE